jgi:hypothetical protein
VRAHPAQVVHPEGEELDEVAVEDLCRPAAELVDLLIGEQARQSDISSRR